MDHRFLGAPDGILFVGPQAGWFSKAQIMRLRDQFRRLFWNKLGTIAKFASIIGIPLTLALFALTSRRRGEPRESPRTEQIDQSRLLPWSLAAFTAMVDSMPTDLALSDLEDRFGGRSIDWTATVRSVRVINYPGGIREIEVTVVQEEHPSPTAVRVYFSHVWEADLADAHPGDAIRFVGQISFDDFVPWPLIQNARLVKLGI